MKRATSLAYFGSLLLLLSGCAHLDYGNVEGEETWAALEVSPSRDFETVPSRDDVIAHWELPSTSPWLPYAKLTLPSVLPEAPSAVSLPRVDELADVQVARLAGARVAADGIPPYAAWFVDLPGAASVAFAHALSNEARDPIAIIPTFNNWPAIDELIPTEETLAAMIALPPRLGGSDGEEVGARPVFLLDSWRLAYKEETIPDDVVDNRYMLTNADLPSAEVLRGRGITEIVYVVASPDIYGEEDDLHDLFAEYESAGIAIFLVDVGELAGSEAPAAIYVPWYTTVHVHRFIVRRRWTIVRDPLFYRRSPGGFGGGHLLGVPGGHVHVGYSSGG